MAEETRRPRTLKEIVEESPYWDADELIRNLDAEMDRMEHGIGHLVWDSSDRPVTRCPGLLPVTPRFKIKESEDTLRIDVVLPNVPEDRIKVKIDKSGVEVSACTAERVCKPYYLNIESRTPLDPDSAKLKHVESTLEIEVAKAKKRRVAVRQE